MPVMDVVIVESATKAKTLHKYLGGSYHVLASYGHVRDLPSQNGSVRPDDDFAMDWVEIKGARDRLKRITKALDGASTLYLATDPDREGEAISWHIVAALQKQQVFKDKAIDIKRVVFHEVTPDAVRHAMSHPRAINQNLVDAYFARRALDYLVGFTLSPLLWRKLPGSRSAGRVQSVALKLICERELEIEAFEPQEYWQLVAQLTSKDGESFKARLTHREGKKIAQYGLTQDHAHAAQAILQKSRLHVGDHKTSLRARRPSPPFTTSTMQQEAARQLGFSAKRTMRTAQQLYEGIDIGHGRIGLITYMRTDSTHLANDAVTMLRRHIESLYGKKYVPEQKRLFKKKAKNAQEAHEAIRPTDCTQHADTMRASLTDDQHKLYGLIWRRAMACQMADAQLEQVSADISTDDGSLILRANGNRVLFDGFLKLYEEGRDDDDSGENKNQLLPPLHKGDAVSLQKVDTSQHFTKPPPRYSEASLVKKMEELGIGRPSTYASIIDVLQQRQYVTLENRRFMPENRGRILTCFLNHFFNRHIAYDFTASLENQLDDIAQGRHQWKSVLGEFWQDFTHAMTGASSLSTRAIIDALNETLAELLFPDGEQVCPRCEEGRLSLKLSRYGAFIGCTLYPECRYSRSFGSDGNEPQREESILGVHPDGGEVTMRHGPYGAYLHWEREGAAGKKTPKPKRFGLTPHYEAETVDFAKAVRLLSLPREVTRHKEMDEMIMAHVGRFGAYLQCGWVSATIPKDEDVLTIGANRAMELIETALQKKRARGDRELGTHPSDGKLVVLVRGRYGFYVGHNAVRAPLPHGTEAKELTLEQGLALLAAKARKGKIKPQAKSKAKTATKRRTHKAKKVAAA